MNRRKFFHYGALGSASFLFEISMLNHKQTTAFFSANMTNKKRYDWIILYWMPYDNNLSSFGFPILGMLTRGVQSENLLVAVQSDFSGAPQLSRHIITKGKINREKLDTTNSADEKVFEEYLDWAKSQFQAEKWAIVFLGHGGSLDEISPDENPELGAFLVTKWMNIKKLSDVITSFNSEVENRVELVFLQNCNKGTLEVLYTFKDTAKYTLSSQRLLGAPNYYYEQLFQFLGNHPEINGGQLAEKIMQFEPVNMYYSYTATNNEAVRNLPAKINPLIESIIVSGQKTLKKSDLKVYSYGDEEFVDVISFFQSLIHQSSVVQQHYQEFVEFYNNSLIHKVQHHGTLLGHTNKYPILSGLGIFLPRSKQALEKYRYLPAFSDLKLAELFEAILFN
jgi:hypothetical protein